jgi:ABC-type bacteriocin/lantibiotic exporter with double-glycine peptidase domain
MATTDEIRQQSGSDRRMTALMTAMGAKEPPASKDVVGLMQHREQQMRMDSVATQIFCAECAAEGLAEQANREAPPSRTQLLLAAWRSVQMGIQTLEKRVLLAWQKLQRVLLGVRRRRVPVLLQLSAIECGAACLAMILSYYGRKTSVSEVRDRVGIGRDGLTALDIVKAARGYGMRVRAVSLQENDFRHVTLPAIVHWEFNHYLIVERWTPAKVDLVDPAAGRRTVTAEEFDKSFTGVVLMLEPGVQFDRSTIASRVNLRTYAVNYAKLAPLSFLQIIGASVLLQLFGLALPLATAVVVNSIIPLEMKDALALLALGLFILLIAQLITALLRAVVLLYVQTKIDTQTMISFIEQLLSLPQRFFQQRSSGDILARLSSNIIIRDTISNQLVTTVLDGSFVVVYLIILLVASPLFCLLVVVIALVQVALLLTTNRFLRAMNGRELTALGKSQGYVVEALTGIATLKAAGAEQRILGQWTNLFFEQMNISVRRNLVSWTIDTFMNTLRTFSPLLLVVVGTIEVLNGTMQVGTMLALVALATAFLTPVGSLVTSGQRLQLVRSHLERVADVLEAAPEQDISTVNEPPKLTGAIRLEHVNFQYDPHSPLVLHDINVYIKPGQKVAIVGRTGSGKSTLGNLLLGMNLPTSGEIFFDTIPLRTMNYQAVRSQFGVVLQGSAIFSGSIRENITLNNPTMTFEQVIKAAQMAAIHDDVMQMAMEYETLVSEGGSALSGGQRQRLALARAFANAPVILLLDEATSALDVVTERVVEENLRKLECTQIIIAHRLSTIRNADMILVIDQGTIVERGTHGELLQQNGYYAKLIQSQLASGEIKGGENNGSGPMA